VQLESSLQVAASPEQVWEFLLDLERVTPCMPGAELEELVDEKTWKGKMSVKLGAVSLAYATTVVIDERDDANRTVVLKADARETRGKGMASATVTSKVEPTDAGDTQVEIVTDLTLTGAVAQYGRGMIADVSKRLTDEFASCISARLTAPAEAAGADAEPVAAKPIGGLRLGLWAFFRAIGRQLKRLWGTITGPFRRR
jgi:carbon monoxide dehydrogenase subunit G